jgi:hypothetical protein
MMLASAGKSIRTVPEFKHVRTLQLCTRAYLQPQPPPKVQEKAATTSDLEVDRRPDGHPEVVFLNVIRVARGQIVSVDSPTHPEGQMKIQPTPQR